MRTALFRLASNRNSSAAERWLGKPGIVVAWLGFLLAIVTPPHGFGVPVCFVQSATGLPCLGCGLSRSLSCGLRGMFAESWHYHPMGLGILIIFVFITAQSLLPGYLRSRLKEWMNARSTILNAAYLGFVILFVCYGVIRVLTSALSAS